MLKIRLTQTGSRNRKSYRIIAIEEGHRRDGRALEILGHYNPMVEPEDIRIDATRVDYWVSKGAQVTDAVKKLLEPKKTV